MGFLPYSFINKIHAFITSEKHIKSFFYIGFIFTLFFVPISQIIPINLVQYQTASATSGIVLDGTKATSDSVIIPLSKILPSNYVLKNIHDNTVDTWVAWNVAGGRIIHIHVTNSANVPQNMIDAMNSAILSTKTVAIDDSITGRGPKGSSSTYYVGWAGAVNNAYSESIKHSIPQKFDINGSPNEIGDIEIILTNDVDPDGYSGYTKSVADGNQILKSKIIIYKANNLDANNLGAIVRHEFGHALGLGHSTVQEDLMHTVLPEYPYISSCDIDALKGLYDGEKNSKVICKQ